MSLISTPAAGIDSPPTAPPFASYAQLVRMLVPSAAMICFYDHKATPLWLTDGPEEAELRRLAALTIARAHDDTPPPPIAHEDTTALALPIRDGDGAIIGVLGLLLQHLPTSALYRRAGALERLLMPLLQVLAHGLRAAAAHDGSTAHTDTVAARRAAIIGPAARAAVARGAHVPAPPATAAPPAMPPSEIIQLPMERRVRTALRTNGLILFAQPIASLRDDAAPTRHEVLVRLCEGSTLHLPHVFFDAAEEHGLLADLDRWVIGNLIKQLAAGDARHQEERVLAVNVSPESLRQETLATFVETQLSRSGVPAGTLIFEFAEYSAAAQQDAFSRTAHRLHELGCRIALDNCRQGLDVFRLVQRSPITCLKLDAALTHHVVSDERAARVIREVAEVASDIGIETVAERVEDARTYDKLRGLCVDFVQGFHVAQPRLLADVLEREGAVVQGAS